MEETMLLTTLYLVLYTLQDLLTFIKARSIFKARCTVMPHSYCVKQDVCFYFPIQLKTEPKQSHEMIMQSYIQEESGLEPTWTQNHAPVSSVQCPFYTQEETVTFQSPKEIAG